MSENTKQVARLMRQNLVKLQGFSSDEELADWVKPFIC
jgi:hypothetical protein